MAGVFSMFALATGILRVAGKDTVHPMLKAVADEAVDGLLITDPRGRVIYANAAYLDLVGATGGLSPAQGGPRGQQGAGGGAGHRA